MLDETFNSVPECMLVIGVLLKATPECICIIDGFQNLGHSQGHKIKNILGDLLALFRGERTGQLLITSSGPNSFLASFDRSMLDRLDISKLVETGRFVLSAELIGVPW